MTSSDESPFPSPELDTVLTQHDGGPRPPSRTRRTGIVMVTVLTLTFSAITLALMGGCGAAPNFGANTVLDVKVANHSETSGGGSYKTIVLGIRVASRAHGRIALRD